MRLGAQLFALGLAVAAWAPAAGAQLPSIPISTAPYTHNMSIGACVYSGTFCVHVQQWGAYAVDTTQPVWSVNSGMVSPVEDTEPGFQPAALTRCDGDFHQSAEVAAASGGAPKWVVTTIASLGTHYNCNPVANPYQVQVYSLAYGAGLEYVGQAFVDSFGSNSVIIDDTAYIDKGDGTWAIVDLTSCTNNECTVGASVTALPALTPQSDIFGYTYSLGLDTDGGLVLVRAGSPTSPPDGGPDAGADAGEPDASSSGGAGNTDASTSDALPSAFRGGSTADDSGCGCKLSRGRSSRAPLTSLSLLVLGVVVRRARRRQRTPGPAVPTPNRQKP